MARTKSSRGVAPFTLRSGNSPLPLIGGLIGGAIDKFRKKKNKNQNPGNIATQNVMAASGEENTEQKINEIHAALVGEDETGIEDSMAGQAQDTV
tara:strand:- start:899 stop:1183 length:285 start_codon:yes stop_codon:yes gene_type:complete